MSGLSLIPSSTVGSSPVATYMRNGLHVGVGQVQEFVSFKIRNIQANIEKVISLAEIDYYFMPVSAWMYYTSPTGTEQLYIEVTSGTTVTGLLTIPANSLPYKFPPVILSKDNGLALTATGNCPLLIVYGQIVSLIDERTW